MRGSFFGLKILGTMVFVAGVFGVFPGAERALPELSPGGSVFAQAAEAPAKEKGADKSVKSALDIAFVDMQAAILQTEEGKAAKVKIEKEAQTKRDALIKQQDDLNNLGQEFQAQQSVLSEESKLEKQKEIQNKMQSLRSAQMSFEQEVRRKEMEETQKIIETLQKIIDELAKKKGYELVFERGAGALLYASAIQDITPEVVKIFNERSKLKGKSKESEEKK